MDRSAGSKQRQSAKQQKQPQPAAEQQSPAAQQSPPAPMYSAANLQKNFVIVNHSRTYVAILAGVVAGIVGLTGISGFLCYFFIMAIGAVALFIKTGLDVNKYFDTWKRIGGLDGLMHGGMSFVLFWTLAYDFVHLF